MLGGNNAYVGGTTVESGTLSISSDANLGIAGVGTLTMDAGTTLNATGVTTLDHAVVLNGDPTIEIDSGTTKITSTITGVGAELVKTGAGTLVLDPANGPNTYSGGTTLDGGTLEIATSGAGGTGSFSFGANANADLKFDSAALPGHGATSFSETFAGFSAGDTIELGGVPIGANETVSYSSGGVLTFSNGSVTDNLTITGAEGSVLVLGIGSDGNPFVTSYSTLNAAIAVVNAATSGSFTPIQLTSNIAENANPDRDQSACRRGHAADHQRLELVAGGDYAINGQNLHRGLFVQAGTVTLDDLIIENATAVGGNGVSGGGGGAGLGGGLFVGFVRAM